MASQSVFVLSGLLFCLLVAPAWSSRVKVNIENTEELNVTGIKCCLVKEGVLAPWYFSVNNGLHNIELDVSGKICTQPQGWMSLGYCSEKQFDHCSQKDIDLGHCDTKYQALFELKKVETLSDSDCTTGGIQIPACDDFDTWKQVLIEEGINKPREKGGLAPMAALEEMPWGTSKVDGLWKVRMETVKELGQLYTHSGGHGNRGGGGRNMGGDFGRMLKLH